MSVVVIDYGMGNLRSVSKALEAAGAEVRISSDPDDLASAERVVLPGVGAFGDAIRNLREKNFVSALNRQVMEVRKPFLGICLGMQLLSRKSYEHGDHEGLGWIDAEVKLLPKKSEDIKLPHMGWNEIQVQNGSPLFSGVRRDPTFYFVHSFYVECRDPRIVAATSKHGISFTAAIQSENIFATQFHPEKSQENGQVVLRNFLKWRS